MCSLDPFEFHIKLSLYHRLKIDAHQPVLGRVVCQCVGRAGIIDVTQFDKRTQVAGLVLPFRARNVDWLRVRVSGFQFTIWPRLTQLQHVTTVGS